MNKPRVGLSDVLLTGALVLLVLAMFFLSFGCASTPHCPAEIEIVEVKVPVYSCPQPPELPPLDVPAFFPVPETPTDAELKSWYAEVAVWVKARHQILLDRIEYLDSILEEYRPIPD